LFGETKSTKKTKQTTWTRFLAHKRRRIVPIYEYQCESCPDRIEVKQSMKDNPLTACPKCGKSVQRLISSPAIMFKGSGWYVTDYSDKMKPSAGNETPVPAAGEKKEKASTSSDQPAPAATATPTPAPSSAPASAPSSTASSSSGTTTSSSSAK
jgi:putative FmdB family regulatory protein